MSIIDDWKSLSDEERNSFLRDRNKFTSYSDNDYELAEFVVADLRKQVVSEMGKVSISNKGGYLILEASVPIENYDEVTDKCIHHHLGFNVYYYRQK